MCVHLCRTHNVQTHNSNSINSWVLEKISHNNTGVAIINSSFTYIFLLMRMHHSEIQISEYIRYISITLLSKWQQFTSIQLTFWLWYFIRVTNVCKYEMSHWRQLQFHAYGHFVQENPLVRQGLVPEFIRSLNPNFSKTAW